MTTYYFQEREKYKYESFSYDYIYPSFTIFFFSPLHLNFSVLRRNCTLSPILHIPDATSPHLNNGFFIKPRKQTITWYNYQSSHFYWEASLCP